MQKLFETVDGSAISDESIKDALKKVAADQCETLFIHSDIMFGRLISGIKRKDLLECLYQVIARLGIKKIIVPTFTYSFCNKEKYDITNSRTTMGAFNEYIRKKEGRYRTIDPLLSISVPNELKEKFSLISEHSLGEGSAFDILHTMDDVKFLFFGAEMGECFTYIHYVEKMMNVPYRFDMPFEGEIIFPDNSIMHRKQVIHTQCYGVELPPKYDYFENEMEEKGFLKKEWLGDKYIACLTEKDAYREIKRKIDNNISFFLSRPFKQSELIHKYTYSTNDGRISHC